MNQKLPTAIKATKWFTVKNVIQYFNFRQRDIMAKELLSWTCPKCGKLITSLYPRQLAQNRSQHEMSCVQKEEGGK